MSSLRSDFETILRREQAASWNLERAVDHLQLDLQLPFLPESLARTAHLDCLEPSEKLLLNQLQGHTYAHLFFYVEEFIVAHAQILLNQQQENDSFEAQSLSCLIEQERKHQALFRAFSDAFTSQIGYQCRCVDDHLDAARLICAHSDLSVMLLMTMLEWVTQRHYMLSFKRDARELDPCFCELFHLHWTEEAHHTTVDTMEIDQLVRDQTGEACQNAVIEFLSLCNMLEDTLRRQAELDLDNFSGLLDRDLPADVAGPVLDALYCSYGYMFLGLGLGHPVFLKIVDEVAPGNDGILLKRSYGYSRPVSPN